MLEDLLKIKLRIEKLRQEINRHRYEYHVLDKLSIPESVLDALKHELVQLETQYPQFITPDSPTQRVAGKALDKFNKITHEVTQWSFNDVFSADEIREWDERLKTMIFKETGESVLLDYAAELKIDGLHIVLTYEKGNLKIAATRGDGKVGEDVTLNIKTIESVPLNLNEPVNLIAEGEVWMSKSVFEELNKTQEKAGGKLFANPRNAAAGSIRQLDPKITVSRKLDCFVYDISSVKKGIDRPKTQSEELERLKHLGFKVNKHWQHCGNIEECISFWQKWEKKKDSENYWIDGVVFKVNSVKYQDILGYTGKAPRWGMAAKFSAEEVATVVNNIVVQVGRTGALTPVANLTPVRLAGTVVKRATLHNQDEIERLDVRVGDTVIVRKAGEIIPEVLSVLTNLRPANSQKFKMPVKCPVCGSAVSKKDDSVAVYCTNKSCFSQNKENLIHFVSKKGLNIVGLGKKNIVMFMTEGFINEFSDIFKLQADDLLALERFADTSAQKLIKSIEASKQVKLANFIYALGILHVGEETARILAENFSGRLNHNHAQLEISELIKIWQGISLEDWQKISGIGDKVALSIYEYIREAKNLQELRELNALGLKLISVKKAISSGMALTGKKFVLTGTLPSLTREEAKDMIRLNGGEVVASISSKTDYLLAGDEPGSKYTRAREFGVKIIDEAEFKKMLKLK